jgi:pimeloyl-ACP methyl ester carboxylesterase
MTIIVDDLAINYETAGQGKMVLLLHGWGDNLKTFAGLAAVLSKDYRVIVLDLPGFGLSEVQKEAWNLDNYASFLADFLKKLDTEVYAVIGHSNGGALAIRALATGELTAGKLILLASAGIREGKTIPKTAIKVIAKTGKVATFWLPKAQRHMLQRVLYGSIGSDYLVAPQLKETFKLTVAQDVQEDAAKLKLPTLLIFAANDPAIPLSDAKRYHNLIKRSKLEVLDGDDHFVHLDQPNRVTELIKEFL